MASECILVHGMSDLLQTFSNLFKHDRDHAVSLRISKL